MTSGGGTGGAVDTAYVDVQVRHNGEQSMRELEREVEQGADRAGKKGGGALKGAMGSALGALPGLALTAATAVGAAIAGGIGAAVNIAQQAQQGVREMGAELGVSAQEAERLGEVAKRVFGNNWGDDLAGAQRAVANVRREIKGLSETDLQAVTEGSIAIAGRFQEDQAKVAQAVRSVMRSTGASAQEAMDFVTSGFQRGLNKSGDFLDTLNEYGPQFEKVKIPAGELFSLLETGSAAGVLGTDKIADALKEFSLRATDGAKATKEAYASLGLDYAKLEGQLKAGKITYTDLFQTVTDKLKGVKNEADRTNIITALFGGAGEDLGKGLAGLDLAKTKVGDLKGSTDQVKSSFDSLGSVFQTAWRQVLLQLEPVGRELLDLASEAMPQVKAAISQLGPIVTQAVRFLLDGFRQGREAVSQVAPVFQTVFGTLRSVAAQVLPYVMKALTDLRPVVQSLGPLFSAAFNLVAQLWQTVLQPALRDILPVVSAVFGAVAAAVRGAIGIVTGVINAVVALLRGDLPGAVRALEGAFEAGVQGAVGAMKGLLTGVLRVVSAVAPQFASAARDIIAGLIRGIEGGAGLVVQAARNLAQGVISGIKNTLVIRSPSKVTTSFGEFVGIGLVNGMAKTTPAVQVAAARLSQGVVDEVAKARAALESDIKMDAWVAGLRSATAAQLASAQARARLAGDAERYGAVQDELTRRQDVATAATERATEAARREREELANNRAQIIRGEQMERYVQGLRSYTAAQLASNLATARAAGDVDRYNAIKSEQERREDAAAAATGRATEAARQHAEQLASSRKQIQDGLRFDAYVSGLQSYSDQQIKAARSNALAAGDVQKFNAVVAEQKRRVEAAAQAQRDFAAALDEGTRAGNAALDTLSQVNLGGRDLAATAEELPDTGRAFEELMGRLVDLRGELGTPGVADAWIASIEELGRRGGLSAAQVAALKAQLVDLQTLTSGPLLPDNLEGRGVPAGTVVSQDDPATGALGEGERQQLLGIAVQMDPDELTAQLALLEGAKLGASDLAGVYREALAQIGAATAEALSGIAAGVGEAGNVILQTEDQLRGIGVASEETTPAVFDLAGALANVGQFETVGALNAVIDAAGLTEDQAQALRDAWLSQNAALMDLVTGYDEAGNAIYQTDEQLRGIGVSTDEASESFFDLGAAVQNVSQFSRAELEALITTAGLTAEQAEVLRTAWSNVQLSATLNLNGFDTGVKKLDLLKTAVQGVVDIIAKTFESLVDGSAQSAGDVVKSMAVMALGVIKQIALMIAAQAAYIAATALIDTATLNPRAILTLAAAAAVAGIAAGLQSRLGAQASAATPATPSTGTRGTVTGTTAKDSGSVSIPTSQVTVMAAPEWVAQMGAHVDRMGRYINRLVEEGITVHTDTPAAGGQGRSLGWDLGTGR